MVNFTKLDSINGDLRQKILDAVRAGMSSYGVAKEFNVSTHIAYLYYLAYSEDPKLRERREEVFKRLSQGESRGSIAKKMNLSGGTISIYSTAYVALFNQKYPEKVLSQHLSDTPLVRVRVKQLKNIEKTLKADKFRKNSRGGWYATNPYRDFTPGMLDLCGKIRLMFDHGTHYVDKEFGYTFYKKWLSYVIKYRGDADTLETVSEESVLTEPEQDSNQEVQANSVLQRVHVRIPIPDSTNAEEVLDTTVAEVLEENTHIMDKELCDAMNDPASLVMPSKDVTTIESESVSPDKNSTPIIFRGHVLTREDDMNHTDLQAGSFPTLENVPEEAIQLIQNTLLEALSSLVIDPDNMKPGLYATRYLADLILGMDQE